ncbi:hypothetical protein T459_33235 [Capsicum annuum]|uniref:Ubiquitin-like protease family profile domain-containing protein n=1 Tax=Capsicum annuum TaxID=4072 RepID=A0A2G2XZN7_CAPAN|nr:hypothetical protein T459_33235 [Capsicum annuum]
MDKWRLLTSVLRCIFDVLLRISLLLGFVYSRGLNFGTTLHTNITLSLLEVVYGRPPTTLARYIIDDTSNPDVVESFCHRDETLSLLKSNLQDSQVRMKRNADKERKYVSFEIGYWVLPPSEATWEGLPAPTHQFPALNLEDKQQHEDTDLEAQQMDYAGVKISPQQFNPIVDQNLGENQDATKGCTDLHPDKTNIEIDSQHLIPDELLQSINLDYNLSEKIVHHDVRITDEKINKTNLSDSQFTISDELLPSLSAYRRESITTDPSATREEEPSNEYFNDKKSKSVVQDHCQKNKENVGSSSKPYMHGEVDLGTEEQIMTTPKIQELTTDEQRYLPVWHDSQNTIPDELLPSLNVYSSKSIIVHPSRELQIPLQKLRIREPSKFKESPYTMKFGSAAVEDIYIPVNIKEKHHWVLAILSFSERCIFLYDSYESSGHYPAVLAEIEKLAGIILLCLQQSDFYINKGIDVENHPRYKDKDSADMFDVLFQENLPQQPSGSL